MEIIGDLGSVYRNQGNYAQAEPLLEQALEGRRRALGETHPETLTNLNNLTVLYYWQGKYGAAESAFAELLKTRRSVIGEAHPYTLQTMQTSGGVSGPA